MIIDRFKKYFLKIEHIYFAEDVMESKSDITRYFQFSTCVNDADEFSSPIIDLNNDLEKIKLNFRKSLRYEVAEASTKYSVVSSYYKNPKLSIIEEFCEFYDRFALARNLPISDRGKIERLKQYVILSSAEHLGKSVVWHLYIYDDVRVRLLYSATQVTDNQDVRNITVRANKFLHFCDIAKSQEDGFRIYDFGGISLDQPELDGINRFKLGFTKKIEVTYNYSIANTIMGKVFLFLKHVLIKYSNN